METVAINPFYIEESVVHKRPAIRVTLPRECATGEIIDAFIRASTFIVSMDVQWIAQPYGENSRLGVYAMPAYRQTHWQITQFIFGCPPESWRTIKDCDQIVLEPLDPNAKHNSVAVTFFFTLATDKWGEPTLVATDYSRLESAGLGEHRRRIERIVAEFLASLKTSTP